MCHIPWETGHYSSLKEAGGFWLYHDQIYLIPPKAVKHSCDFPSSIGNLYSPPSFMLCWHNWIIDPLPPPPSVSPENHNNDWSPTPSQLLTSDHSPRILTSDEKRKKNQELLGYSLTQANRYKLLMNENFSFGFKRGVSFDHEIGSVYLKYQW